MHPLLLRKGDDHRLVARGARLLALLLLFGVGACSAGPLGTLDPLVPFTGTEDLAQHYREHMVPLVVIGETVYLPSETCVGLMQRHLGTAQEERSLASDQETRIVSQVGEDRRLDTAAEERELAGENEDRSLGSQDESRELAGEEESRELAGEDEDRNLDSRDESRRLAGEDERRGLEGDDENRLLGGEVQRLECRRLGDGEFQILQAQRLQPSIYMGQRLVPVPDGSVTF